MQSKTVFKKLAVFMLVLSLVLSVAGTALADHSQGQGGPQSKPDTVNIVYDLNGGTAAAGFETTQTATVSGKHTNDPEATFTLPGANAATKAGHVLTGWKVGGKTKSCGATVTVDVDYNRNRNKWNDICVEAVWMEVREESFYNLYYTGTFIDGAIFWPADVVGVTAPPALAGNPYRAGYNFTGWKPGTLDWSKAEIVINEEYVNPPKKPAYIKRIITYTIRVEGSFTLEPVPVQPQQPPVGAPQTGAAEWAGVAGAAALLSSFGLAFIARRRKDD